MEFINKIKHFCHATNSVKIFKRFSKDQMTSYRMGKIFVNHIPHKGLASIDNSKFSSKKKPDVSPKPIYRW